MAQKRENKYKILCLAFLCHVTTDLKHLAIYPYSLFESQALPVPSMQSVMTQCIPSFQPWMFLWVWFSFEAELYQICKIPFKSFLFLLFF